MRKIVLAAIIIGSATSFAAFAQFSTSEYGSGELNTGTPGTSLFDVNSFDALESENLSTVSADLGADCTASNLPDAIDFMDTDADGTLTCQEVVDVLESTSDVTFTDASPQQATFIIDYLDACSTIDTTCLAGAAIAANNFLTTTTSAALSADLTGLATGVDDGGSVSVSSYPSLSIFDTDHDGQISDTEVVNLIDADPNATGIVRPAGDEGRYARAYLNEISQLTGDETYADAISRGNNWAVNAPQITAPSSLALDGTDSTIQTDAFTVYDGNCGTSGGSGCTAQPGNVDYAVTTTMGNTTWSGSTGNVQNSPFIVNSAGRLVVNAASSGVSNIQDLDAGTYTISVTATDDNTDSYGRTATVSSLSLTVSNENGCILDNGIVANDFNAGGSVSNITGGAVTIANNHNSNDLLFVKGATSTTTLSGKRYTSIPGHSGITAEYFSSSGVLRFYGTTTEDNWVDIFKKVAYIYNSSGSASSNTRGLVFSMSNKVPYEHDDGGWHFYEYIANDNIDFNVIMDDVDDATYTSSSDTHYLFGLKPYLATITSQAEQNYIYPKIQGQGWIGGCDKLSSSVIRGRCNAGGAEFDDDTDISDGQPFNNNWKAEGKWVWVTGPERGTPIGTDGDTDSCDAGTFTSATIAANTYNNTSSSSVTSYENWADGSEPNDCTYEHHLHVYGSGAWNDYNASDDRINGYVVEWGGPTSSASYGQVGGSALDLIEEKNYNMSTEGQFCSHQ